MPSDHQVPFPRPPCSQLGQELALSMPRSALKMANLWAPGAVPEDQGALKIAQSHSPTVPVHPGPVILWGNVRVRNLDHLTDIYTFKKLLKIEGAE